MQLLRLEPGARSLLGQSYGQNESKDTFTLWICTLPSGLLGSGLFCEHTLLSINTSPIKISALGRRWKGRKEEQQNDVLSVLGAWGGSLEGICLGRMSADE